MTPTNKQQQRLIIIAGPTASGKSDFALEIASKIDGEIVNADSMQIYSELPILTCSPTNGQKALIPHNLYNYKSLSEHHSVSKFIDEATNVIDKISSRHKVPIIVGGTGLYIKALCEGLSPIPEIPLDIRQHSKALLEKIGNEAFYHKLAAIDFKSATKLHPNNSQRLIRAYEVVLHTKKSIFDFQELDPKSPISNYQKKILILTPERNQLYQNCNKRFEKLLDIGAIEEVKAIADKTPPKEVNVIGYKEIYDYILEKISRDKLVESASQKTRRYAKRQVTFFKHQLKGIEVPSSNVSNFNLDIIR